MPSFRSGNFTFVGTHSQLVLTSRGEIISAGNFHGEYPAKAMDYLAIGIHELGSMSERRIERLVNPALSELPAFLTKNGGLNSGFMIAHCTAAALVSENKTLCHPASVDSLSTSAAQEDHVSMGGFAARKALQVVGNVEKVIAIELLCACQAMEFLRPLRTTTPLEEVYRVVRKVVRPWDEDRYMSPDIEAVIKVLQTEKVWHAVKKHIDYFQSAETIEMRVFSPTASGILERPRPGEGGGRKRSRSRPPSESEAEAVKKPPLARRPSEPEILKKVAFVRRAEADPKKPTLARRPSEAEIVKKPPLTRRPSETDLKRPRKK
ncbi:unnamed protein product [Darwinula stevensoni]|uniref:Histidine ammonia-lyase n=1 Tax=Darwinula stevensoni TaxID=69355 RepID=A0A7R9AH86_9CRUS|nr:unnamed protein product [Darwinula stevensoni]CAG0904958.1 unnamed protein product [Darwinula stevensoni]